MSNQNGQLILQTLQFLENPSTSDAISKEIADIVGTDVQEIKATVKETLNAGVRHGFIQRLKGKYFSAPVDDIEIGNAELKENSNKKNNAKETEEKASRRRKRSRSRSGRRRGGRRAGSKRRRQD